MAEAHFSAAALSLLKADLGYYNSELPPDVETHLMDLLNVAFRRLARAHINLDIDCIDDAQLQAMYAAWLYRKRRDGSAKPLMLQQEMRDRQVDLALTDDEEEDA